MEHFRMNHSNSNPSGAFFHSTEEGINFLRVGRACKSQTSAAANALAREARRLGLAVEREETWGNGMTLFFIVRPARRTPVDDEEIRALGGYE